MKILITGGAGFVGHHLTLKLLSLGHRVIGVDNLTTGSLHNIQDFKNNSNYSFFHFSAVDKDKMKPLVEESDVIFNLAASVGVQNVFKNPIDCIENNIDIARTILNLSTEFQKRLFMFSTSEVYGKQQSYPFTEDDDSVFGSYKSLRWGYATSKLIDDYMSRAHFESYKTPVTTVRLFNAIGIKQVGHYGMVVPSFFNQALKNKPITVFGDGQQSRCFTDVRDVIRCLIQLIPCVESHGELINIGSHQEISILDLALKIKMLTQSESEIQLLNYDQAYGERFEDIQRRVPSTLKLDRLIGVQQNFSLDETLSWIHSKMKLEALAESQDVRSRSLDLQL